MSSTSRPRCRPTHVTISLRQLVHSQPFSAFRKRLNRRLPMGYDVVQWFRRKQE